MPVEGKIRKYTKLWATWLAGNKTREANSNFKEHSNFAKVELEKINSLPILQGVILSLALSVYVLTLPRLLNVLNTIDH